ncbi:MAG: 3-isopropylmalate dehydrogenase [Ignavibacteria bacterium CG_4_8_14_3_um_filter_37_9]|nr:3-isopropylmalate dehydrogenase [Ignavibacteria bacterium]OIO20964.1 MAG: 3-isopropylmalate dehydrogenase [Ignavibacteria bacterium CG1_02_37_35]PIX00038.1 MAG: 3-isopropylmalate dehydrogenase [Ignavibacteria bacterium CG_4_8_14_3_um_filter_37_9]PJC61241.1 MAG: 3-isopropylmalate dehydrogenase [Ignavibacteria bacterium CG_4_9_14_0_2_um_filter_37_13]
MKYKIVLLPGDGIGPEVTDAAVKVLQFVAEKIGLELSFSYHLMGGCSYDANETPLTDATLNACYDSDAVFLGAVGGVKWESLPHHLKPEAALLKIRKSLGLFSNIRPAKVYNALIDASSLRPEVLSGTDLVIFRELTGGIYFGEPRGYDEHKGWNTLVYSTEEVERIARKAFAVARQRSGRVTSVDKANVLESSQFWRKIVHQVHEEFRDVKLNDMYVDNAAMQLVRNPKQFDVILTQNLFGDILSDVAAMITGSLGMLPSASLGEKYALYEPVHGSAPDIAGQNKANPLASIASIALMFSYTFNLPEIGLSIEDAIAKTLEKNFRTADIFSEGMTLVSTTVMRDEVLKSLEEVFEKNKITVTS